MPDALTPALSLWEREKTDAPRPHVGPVSVGYEPETWVTL